MNDLDDLEQKANAYEYVNHVDVQGAVAEIKALRTRLNDAATHMNCLRTLSSQRVWPPHRRPPREVISPG